MRRTALARLAPAVVTVVALLLGGCTADGGGTQGAGRPTPGTLSVPVAESPWTVAKENRLPGTTAWKLRNPGPTDAIEGYTDRVSVLPGQSFQLYVSTTGSSFRIEAFRMGWYGGRQGRLVWHSDDVPAHRQPAARRIPGINEVYAPWTPTTTVSTADWPQGDYLLKLVSNQGHDRWVPLTLRSPSTSGRTVFMNSVTTWAAYNKWGGGYNVYGGGYKGYKGAGDYNERSRKASFDRPYDKNGSYFNWYELPALSLAEQMGIPLAYETDIELSTAPQLFQGARSLFFAGHDEYWTSGMRNTALRVRNAGTNIAFLSSNTAYRHVRLENSQVGRNRVVVVYKNAAEDPMTLTDPAEATQQWRLPPDPRPESVLTGVYYECNPVYGDFVVTDPRAWMFAGTGVKAGQHFPGLVNVETDRLTGGVPVPRPIQVLSQSPVTCQIPGSPLKTHSNSAYYTVPSGAGVFATGTMGWSCSLGGATGCRGDSARAKRVPAVSGDFARQVTANILRVFQEGPAGRTHPARDNYRRYVSPPSKLTYTR